MKQTQNKVVPLQQPPKIIEKVNDKFMLQEQLFNELSSRKLTKS